ncbi:MAG: RtcB family protein [Desulfobacterales bacterium]|nr:RtcB family protein [Desulfobacterales bacterium]
MKWTKSEPEQLVPIHSWCEQIEKDALTQAENLSKHPVIFHHVALMPDCHVGYGMPIGGVGALKRAISPNMVGVDIGCGMGAIETTIPVSDLAKETIRKILTQVKSVIPRGEGNAHKKDQDWNEFDRYSDTQDNNFYKGWWNKDVWKLAKRNLGTLGGGNHFIEIQASEEGFVWIMLHSGSRNLGYKIAEFYNKVAIQLNEKMKISLPSKDLAYLPIDSDEGQAYLKDMQFAMAYARENRARMMQAFKESIIEEFDCKFLREINIHHNFASLETHFGLDVWVHRKGATSAQKDEFGIIPGSMGTPSYITVGLGNPESFCSCSHGAGRVMGRMQASRQLTLEECDAVMKGIVYDRWPKGNGWKKKSKGEYDFGEAPQAYKNIDNVIQSQLDLITPLIKLRPLGVVKG